MADRIIRWHIKGVLSETGVVGTDVEGQVHRLDRDYIPEDTWLRVKRASQGLEGTGIIVDINDDGVSIFGENLEANLPDNTLEDTCHTFSSTDLVLRRGSILTLDIDQVGVEYAGKDLVVELYLREA